MPNIPFSGLSSDAISLTFDSLLVAVRSLSYGDKRRVMEDFATALEAVVSEDAKSHIGRMCRSRVIGFSSDASDWSSVVAVYEISRSKGFGDSVDEFIQSATVCVALCEMGEFDRAVELRDVLRVRFAKLWSGATAARLRVERLLSSRDSGSDVESD